MSILDKLNNFAAKSEELALKLEAKTAVMAENAKKYAEEERIKDFYKIKSELIEINKKQRALGIKETTIFDFFKDRSEYADLLELEKSKI